MLSPTARRPALRRDAGGRVEVYGVTGVGREREIIFKTTQAAAASKGWMLIDHVAL